MSSVELVADDDPDPADIAELEARVAEQTARVTGHADERPLAVLVRDDDGSLVAGLSGWTWGGTCELQHLWVDPSRRFRALGTRLLDAAEAEAARRGCTQVVLFTHAANTGRTGNRWTTRGYQLVGRVDDYPTGDAALWYRKPLI
ncbi:MAG: GNAT family N-acetyltransferase [Acidimicrobiales bacterium]